jgi:DNA repair photolyase
LSPVNDKLKVTPLIKPFPDELRSLLKGCKTDILRILSGNETDPDPAPEPDPSESPKPPSSPKPAEPDEVVEPEIKKVSPVTLSTSYRTDIPGFHSGWFFNRLDKGYLVYTPPRSSKQIRVSFENTRLIVFWTKNPAPMAARLDELDQRGIGYYFQYTLNDYEAEGLEPNLPSLENRIDSFRHLAGRIDKERVIWRFDPLILTDTITPEILIQRVARIAKQLSGHTEKLVISFFKCGEHKKSDRKLDRAGIQYRDFTADEIAFVAKELGKIGTEHNLTVAACAEDYDLSLYGIEKNKCIDDALIKKVFSHDKALMDHLNHPENLSVSGQRKACRCITSEDIGQYSTCKHNCLYCYANASEIVVNRNFKRIDQTGEILLPPQKAKPNRVQDWSSKTVNCCNGCSNGCLYCYARGEAVLRFSRLTDEQWKLGAVREKDVSRSYPKYDQTVMFPSPHDITKDNFEACRTVLSKLLKSGNRVLVVSKPRPELIGTLCDDFEEYKGQIMFRFTIGASSDEILSFWEPNAPNFADRKEALLHASAKGFHTSVSMEPMLDSDNVSDLVEELRPFVNWRIWIGTMNHAWYIKKYQDTAIDMAFAKIEEGQTQERLQPIYGRYKDDSLIRFKSDFLKKLGLPPAEKSEEWPED